MPRSEALRKAQDNYYSKVKQIKLNFKTAEDADIIDRLNKVDSMTDYIRQLIRKDITERKAHMKRYQVEYHDNNTGAVSPVDIITVEDGYTPEDYRADMELSFGGDHGEGEYTFEELPLFWVVDDCLTKRAAVYTEAVKAENIDEAARIGRKEWDRLSAHDKAQRDAFYVCLAWADEDGELDFDRMEDIRTIPVPEQKKYRVLPEYLDLWTSEDITELIVTEGEIERLAMEWGKDIETLFEQVEEAE